MNNDDKLFFWQAVCEKKYLEGLSFAEAVNEIIQTQASEINQYDDLGMTPLHHAIHDALVYHDETGVKALLEHGADINMTTEPSYDINIEPLNALDFTLTKYQSFIEAVKIGRIKPNYEYQLIEKIIELLKVHDEKIHLDNSLVGNSTTALAQKI